MMNVTLKKPYVLGYVKTIQLYLTTKIAIVIRKTCIEENDGIAFNMISIRSNYFFLDGSAFSDKEVV